MRWPPQIADNDTAPINMGDWWRSIPSIPTDWPRGILTPAQSGDIGGEIET